MLLHALQWEHQNPSFGRQPVKGDFPAGGRSSPFDLLKDEDSCNMTLSQAGASGLLWCVSVSQTWQAPWWEADYLLEMYSLDTALFSSLDGVCLIVLMTLDPLVAPN